jgi:hypothetical protein
MDHTDQSDQPMFELPDLDTELREGLRDLPDGKL